MDECRNDAATVRAAALASALRDVVARLKRRLREQGAPDDLSWSQVSVLAKLEREGPATVTTLARAEGMRPQSMGAIVAALEAAGRVDGAPDPADGRQTLWSVTPACRDWIAAHRAARQDWLLRSIHNRLTAAEQDELARAVALLERIVEP